MTLQLLVLSITTEAADGTQRDLTKWRKVKERNSPWCILLPAINWRHFGPPSRGGKPAYRNRERRLEADVRKEVCHVAVLRMG